MKGSGFEGLGASSPTSFQAEEARGARGTTSSTYGSEIPRAHEKSKTLSRRSTLVKSKP